MKYKHYISIVFVGLNGEAFYSSFETTSKIPSDSELRDCILQIMQESPKMKDGDDYRFGINSIATVTL